MNWKDITLGQFSKLNGLDLNELSDQITAGEILLDIDAGNMTWNEFNKKLKELDFLKEPCPAVLVRDKYVIRGTKYDCLYKLNEMSVSRFMDFQNLTKTGDMIKILGCFLVPEGKEYGDDIEKVYEDLYYMSVVDAFAITNFFQLQFKVCCKTLKDYSVKALKSNPELARIISDSMDYFCTYDQ